MVERELAAAGNSVPVYVGMRNWRPYISDSISRMRADGVEEAAVICMAPQNSRTSVGLYRRAVESSNLRLDFTESWAGHPLLIEAFAERLSLAWNKLSAEVDAPVPVLFTAHSVPTRTVQPAETPISQVPGTGPGAPSADLYDAEARLTAALVAARFPELSRWHFAFQSQGASGGPWLGPTVEETIDAIAASGAKTLLVQPIGFLCDHVEILYDVDIFFRNYAAKIGLRLERAESLNGSVTLAKAVAELARQGLKRLAG
jgi:ferrochelatase